MIDLIFELKMYDLKKKKYLNTQKRILLLLTAEYLIA